MRTLLLAFLLLSAPFIIKAQPPCSTYAGMTPQTAIPVCGATVFHQTNVFTCIGPDITPSPCPGYPLETKHSYWYKFHCYNAGTTGLGFIIKPDNPPDDFDWGLFDVTGHPNLNDIYTTGSMQLSINISGTVGSTGCGGGFGNINCPGDGPFNQLAAMQAGHDYMLMVTNWSNSGLGYTLSFVGGDAVITNNQPPTIANVTVGCNTSSVKISFSEDVLCSSLSPLALGTEFTITNGTNTITGIASACTSGAYGITELTLTLQNPLPAGNYQVIVNNGGDGNTLLDVCQDAMPVGTFFNFTVVVQPPVTINPITYAGCAPTVLNVPLSKPVWCNSVTPLGTEFSILPGNPAITLVQSTCTFGAQYTDLLQIVLQNPLAPGNYQLVVNNGTDGNTLIDTCNNTITSGTSFPFTISAASTPPVIQSIGFDPCHRDKVILNFDKPINCASLTAAGSELSISPGVWPINSITYNCTGGIYTSQVTMNLLNPLPAGNFNVIVNNGTDGNTLSDTCFVFMPVGYSKPFLATAPPPPVIQSFSYDNCKRDKLVVNFDKPIACASLTANGSEFSIPGGPTITGITSNCGANTYTSQVTLLLQSPMPPSLPVNIMISNGADGNTLSDTCFSFIGNFYTAAFTAPPAPPRPVLDSVQYDKCNPSFMKLFYSRPVLCSSISPNGSQFFFIPPPGPVNLISATGDPATCPQGYTNWILVQFSAPINTGGFYPLWHVTGSDGKIITDTCNSALLGMGTNNILLNVLGKPSAVFNSQVKWGCVQDTIVLSHPGGNGINSWTWNFSDGSTATGQAVTKNFPVATPTVGVQLIVSNGSCSDTVSNIITLGNAFNAAFTNTPADTFCINTPVNFTNTSSGTIINYLWDFGDATQFNGQNPPTHIYPLSNTYNVQLTVTDNHGCTNTAGKLLQVNTTAFIDFTGLKPQYCTGNQVVLTRKIASTIDSYVWNNGDGQTFTNEVVVNFSYANEGVYTITLTGNDKYCGPSSVSKTVPVYAVPKVNLGPDTVLCVSDRILIGVPPTGNYTYLWNTGANTSQIYTDYFTRDYSLTADNNGCRGYDALSIKVLPACLIKVPGAFTPNGDGLNDLLKAVNADLAKNFSLKVFNRFGQLLFSTNNPLEGWNGYVKGNKAETGTYVWMLSYIDPWTGNAVKEKGTSILLR